MPLQKLADEALVARCRAERGPARRDLANELFGRYYEKVGRWCFRITGDRESAADLAQEVFVKAWRHLDTFNGSSKFSTWLYTIMRNECLNAAKAKQKYAADTDLDAVGEFADVAALNPESAMANSIVRRNLQALLNSSLDETERNVFTLHFAEELPLDAVTRLLNLTNASGAKAFVVSAKRKLARAVERLHARGGAVQ